MTIRGRGLTVLRALVLSSRLVARADPLADGFARPPAAAMPGVW